MMAHTLSLKDGANNSCRYQRINCVTGRSRGILLDFRNTKMLFHATRLKNLAAKREGSWSVTKYLLQPLPTSANNTENRPTPNCF
ncbi:MAG: hypothetical protein KUG76_07335 [Gammaproteobacteria bacterium]|nr:hypothetical protein [Gammaproteobacteria bacterium]